MAGTLSPYDPDSPREGPTTDELIGQAVRVLRHHRSQRQLAAAMQARGWPAWSQATQWSVETGQRPLRLAEAVDLADELGVTIDALLPTEDEPRHRTPRL